MDPGGTIDGRMLRIGFGGSFIVRAQSKKLTLYDKVGITTIFGDLKAIGPRASCRWPRTWKLFNFVFRFRFRFIKFFNEIATH